MSETNSEGERLIVLVADIVSAYVANNHIQSADLPKLLGDVHEAIQNISTTTTKASEGASQKASNLEIKRSISNEYLISFEDGKPYKTLRRHLTLRGLSPEQYRMKWGLPPDYPMTSANYSVQRSELARSLGLGQQRRKPENTQILETKADSKVADDPEPVAAPSSKRRTKGKSEAVG